MIGSAVQGGQIAAHTFRMTTQVFKTSCLVSFTMSLLYFVYQSLQLPLFYWKAAFYHLLASLFKHVQIPVDASFWSQVTGRYVQSSRINVSADQLYHQTLYFSSIFQNFILNSLIESGWVFLASGMLCYCIFIAMGRKSKRRQLISGKPIVSPRNLSWRLKLFGRASDLKLGPLSLVKGSETKHILVTGSTGSGKTNCFFHLLNQVRKRKNRAVIVDTTGIFVERYYRNSKDILLNPFDPRSVKWVPWIECREKSDFDHLSKSLIPKSHQHSDPFWNTSAQILLSAVLEKLKDIRTNSELVKWILCSDLKSLSQLVANTRAASIVNVDSEKTASSIRAVASNYLSCFQFLEDTDTPFSIRKWIEEENNDSWLFLATTPINRSAISPLLSAWYAIASSSLRSLTIDLDRRVWFVIDELPSLPCLFELENFLSESRKYGGCSLISLQSISQLESIYGREVASTIIANCMTRVVFNEGDMKIAKEISTVFGEIEYNEYNQSLSYGANDVRDGVNLSLNSKIRPIVNPSELSSLKPNHAFVKLPGDYPITRTELRIAD
jgi:type IV conjugative transfer system coupling protein TraD